MTYYDSQSGQWVPSLPDCFTVALDATAHPVLDDIQGLQSGIADKERYEGGGFLWKGSLWKLT